MPAKRPIRTGRLVQEQRANGERLIPKHGSDEPREIPDGVRDLRPIQEIARRIDDARPPDHARRVLFERRREARKQRAVDWIGMRGRPVPLDVVDPAQVRRRPTCAWTNASMSGNRSIGFVAFSSLIVETGRSA